MDNLQWIDFSNVARAEDALGNIWFANPKLNGHASIRVTLAPPKGMSQEEATEKYCKNLKLPKEKMENNPRLQASLRIEEIGRAASQGEAKTICKLLNESMNQDYPKFCEMLTNNGFVLKNTFKYIRDFGGLRTVNLWRKKAFSGFLTITVEEGHVSLKYESKRGGKSHIIVNLTYLIEGDDQMHAILWPDNIKDPQRTAVHIAIEMANKRIAQGRKNIRKPLEY